MTRSNLAKLRRFIDSLLTVPSSQNRLANDLHVFDLGEHGDKPPPHQL
jgi:hypothetical protein